MRFSTFGEIQKFDEERRVVYGWASVFTEKGEPVVDSHGDEVDTEDMITAAHEFISDVRMAKMEHQGAPVGEIVESVVLTTDIQKALGIDLEMEGWFIGVHVLDDDVWAAVKKGELSAFSIGGVAAVEELD